MYYYYMAKSWIFSFAAKAFLKPSDCCGMIYLYFVVSHLIQQSTKYFFLFSQLSSKFPLSELCLGLSSWDWWICM